MFIQVKTFSGFSKPLLYAVPSDWKIVPKVGSIVTVPMRTATVSGVVVEIVLKKPSVLFNIKPATALQAFPNDPHYFDFIQKLSDYHQVDSIHFLKRVQTFFKHKTELFPFLQKETEARQEVILTSEQSAVVDYVAPQITTPRFAPTLIHGVTGSGKTEIYKKLIAHAFRENKTTVLLLPEVTLALQFEKLFKASLAQDLPVLGFHSGSNTKDKKQLWNNLLHNKPQLIIGVHLPILLPIAQLGLILIDEEHDPGFQEKKHPKVNSKEAAIWRASLCAIPIVMGSATPSLPSLHKVKKGNWKLFQLKKRFAGAFPKITFVKLTDKKQRANFWISNELRAALEKQLQKKEQTLLFLNRRGMSFFVQCKNCSHVFCCSSCSVSLTLHADNSLRCHYCGHKEQQPSRCPECKDTEFLRKGIGTQQIVTILQKMFPLVRIGRADMDTTVNRATWQKTLGAFENQELDVLVGTQTITKGYHFPNVTLVGIIWADINLNFPFYNAQETTLQQLIQVAGRAGRQHPESRVIVQAMEKHALFDYVHEIDYLKFYDNEIEQRKEVGYPPIKRFAEIELKHTKEEVVETEADVLVAQLIHHKSCIILGPTQPPVAKIKKVFSRKIYLKADTFTALSKAFSTINQKRYKSKIFFTPNPLS